MLSLLRTAFATVLVASALPASALTPVATPLLDNGQMIVVTTDGWDATQGRLQAYARTAQGWQPHGAAFDVLLKALREFKEDLALWDRAEQLAAASGRVTELAHALRDTLRSELSESIEIELSDRAARLHEDTLGDPMGAAPYLERLLLKDTANQDAFARLKQILTSAERWGELEDLYDRTTRVLEDPATRVDLLTEVALVCEEIIEDDNRAIGYYERILAISPSLAGR